jgi:hypothetical protein
MALVLLMALVTNVPCEHDVNMVCNDNSYSYASDELKDGICNDYIAGGYLDSGGDCTDCGGRCLSSTGAATFSQACECFGTPRGEYPVTQAFWTLCETLEEARAQYYSADEAMAGLSHYHGIPVSFTCSQSTCGEFDYGIMYLHGHDANVLEEGINVDSPLTLYYMSKSDIQWETEGVILNTQVSSCFIPDTF